MTDREAMRLVIATLTAAAHSVDDAAQVLHAGLLEIAEPGSYEYGQAHATYIRVLFIVIGKVWQTGIVNDYLRALLIEIGREVADD